MTAAARRRPLLLAALLAATATLALSGCVAGPGARASIVGPEERPPDPVVQLCYASLPGWLAAIGIHTWLATWDPEEGEWHRWEVWRYRGFGENDHGYVRRDYFSHRGEFLEGAGSPWVGAQWRGERARHLIEVIEREAPRYRYRDSYAFFPGPNCNTFVAEMIRLAGVTVDFHPQAIGKDYLGPAGFGAGTNPSGTSVQAESPFVGAKVGLADGFELHVLGFTFGVDLSPPALETPFGRIGFAEIGGDGAGPPADASPTPTSPPPRPELALRRSDD